MSPKQNAREQIADGLYLLAAGTDEAVLLETLQSYVAVHSKTDEQMLALLRELLTANPTLFMESLGTLIAKPEQSRYAEPADAPELDALRDMLKSDDVSVIVGQLAALKPREPEDPSSAKRGSHEPASGRRAPVRRARNAIT